MKIHHVGKVFLVVMGFFGLWACAGQEWRIRDAVGQVQIIEDIRFEPSDRVEFRVGSSRKWLEANQIQWMSINPGHLQTEGSRVFYGARLILRDGSRLPDSSSVDTISGVYIPTDGLLVGSAHVGRVEIPISKLMELGTMEHYAVPEKD